MDHTTNTANIKKRYYLAAHRRVVNVLSKANFLLKFQNFRYHGNRGWCDINFICTDKFADPENPMFCARIGDISPLQAKLLQIFC